MRRVVRVLACWCASVLLSGGAAIPVTLRPAQAAQGDTVILKFANPVDANTLPVYVGARQVRATRVEGVNGGTTWSIRVPTDGLLGPQPLRVDPLPTGTPEDEAKAGVDAWLDVLPRQERGSSAVGVQPLRGGFVAEVKAPVLILAPLVPPGVPTVSRLRSALDARQGLLPELERSRLKRLIDDPELLRALPYKPLPGVGTSFIPTLPRIGSPSPDPVALPPVVLPEAIRRQLRLDELPRLQGLSAGQSDTYGLRNGTSLRVTRPSKADVDALNSQPVSERVPLYDMILVAKSGDGAQGLKARGPGGLPGAALKPSDHPSYVDRSRDQHMFQIGLGKTPVACTT